MVVENLICAYYPPHFSFVLFVFFNSLGLPNTSTHLDLQIEPWPVTSLHLKPDLSRWGEVQSYLKLKIQTLFLSVYLFLLCARYANQSNLQCLSRVELWFKTDGLGRHDLHPIWNSDCSHLAATRVELEMINKAVNKIVVRKGRNSVLTYLRISAKQESHLINKEMRSHRPQLQIQNNSPKLSTRG